MPPRPAARAGHRGAARARHGGAAVRRRGCPGAGLRPAHRGPGAAPVHRRTAHRTRPGECYLAAPGDQLAHPGDDLVDRGDAHGPRTADVVDRAAARHARATGLGHGPDAHRARTTSLGHRPDAGRDQQQAWETGQMPVVPEQQTWATGQMPMVTEQRTSYPTPEPDWRPPQQEWQPTPPAAEVSFAAAPVVAPEFTLPTAPTMAPEIILPRPRPSARPRRGRTRRTAGPHHAQQDQHRARLRPRTDRQAVPVGRGGTGRVRLLQPHPGRLEGRGRPPPAHRPGTVGRRRARPAHGHPPRRPDLLLRQHRPRRPLHRQRPDDPRAEPGYADTRGVDLLRRCRRHPGRRTARLIRSGPGISRP
jgi:hypothetical protein